MPEITFVGTGEAFDPELPNTSVLYRGARTVLLDCGYAVPRAFWDVCRDPNLLDGIYVSHMHADHSFGLPALLLWMRELGRARPIEVLGGPGTGEWLTQLLELAYPSSTNREGCEIVATELPLASAYRWGELTLSCARSAHSVRNLALRIDDGRSAVCYSGDGAPTPETRKLYANADLLIHECYTAEPEKASHASAAELLAMADELAIHSLALLHFSRSRKDAIRAKVNAHTGTARVSCPAPGDRVSF